VHDAALAFGDAIFGHGVILSVLPAIAFGHAAWALVREETFEKQHEGASKKRMECFQKELNSTGGDDTALKRINARLDAQMKIEDFIVKSREANHPKLKAWGPIYASGAAIVISLAGAYESYRAIEQGWQTRTLEERKANSEEKKAKAEIALKAAGSSPEETRARLTALMEARLLDLSREEIETLSSLWHPKEK
jgi:hypothetical protein